LKALRRASVDGVGPTMLEWARFVGAEAEGVLPRSASEVPVDGVRGGPGERVSLLSICIIAAPGEAPHLERCFGSFWGAVDDVVFCFTGEREDGTVEAAERFAEERGERDKLVTGAREWRDRFDEARNYADGLASGEWLAYIDADEILHGAGWLPRILSVPSASELDALAVSVLSPKVCREVREDSDDVLAPRTTRVRLRATAMLDPRHVRVEQRRDSGRPESMSRNLRIAEQWARDEPDDARAVAMHGFCLYTFHAFRNEPEGMVRAAELAERGQRMTPRWHTAYMLPALVAHMQGRYTERRTYRTRGPRP
jgi:Glycosyl transferase family 2